MGKVTIMGHKCCHFVLYLEILNVKKMTTFMTHDRNFTHDLFNSEVRTMNHEEKYKELLKYI